MITEKAATKAYSLDKRWRNFLLIAILMFQVCWLNIANASDSYRIAVFYPASVEPYRSIYLDIINGSRSLLSKKLDTEEQLVAFVLKPNFNVAEIIEKLHKQNISKVIVLGRLGYQLASELSGEFSVVTGAIPNTPNPIPGISLISDPDFLFRSLKQLAPQVKRIHIAYSKNSEWIIRLAVIAANKQGYSLNLKKVKTVGQAIEFYQQLFSSGVDSQDAVWLPIDRLTSHDRIILPIILEKAWAKDVVVFSSKPSHAKRGALFSTYPDNFRLGQNLYQMLNNISATNKTVQFVPLASLLLAVNLRTASHLGIEYSDKDKKRFKLMFPE